MAKERSAKSRAKAARAKVAQSDVPDNMLALLSALRATGVGISSLAPARTGQDDLPDGLPAPLAGGPALAGDSEALVALALAQAVSAGERRAAPDLAFDRAYSLDLYAECLAAVQGKRATAAGAPARKTPARKTSPRTTTARKAPARRAAAKT